MVKLTNASLVKYKIGNKHFEIICYKNKIIDWRSGNDKNIENIL